MLELGYIYLNNFDWSKDTAVISYPLSLNQEKILIENLRYVPEYLSELIYLMKEYSANTELMNSAVFDIEKSPYANKLYDIQRKIDELSDKMDGNLSPYTWFVSENIDTIIGGISVKADWCCRLEKI